MNSLDLLVAAAGLQRFCDARGWRNCFIGGVAVQRWSEPRVTRDVDLSLMAGFGTEAPFIDALLGHYEGRLPDAREFAQRNRVLLVRTAEGIGIDISLAALEFEREVIERASDFEIGPDLSIRTCSEEDLVVMKLFAGRALDLRDAEGVALRHGRDVDWITSGIV
jgi:hypothetical protein